MLNDPSSRQKRDAIGDMPGEAHLVGNQNEIAPFGLEFLNHIEDFRRHLRVERTSRFVEKQQARFDRDRARYSNALLLAATQLGGPMSRVIGKTESIKGRECNLTRLPGGEAVNFLERQEQILECGEMREKIVRLEHYADVASMLSKGGSIRKIDRRSIDARLAVIRLLEPRDDPEKRGLSTATWTDERECAEFAKVYADRIEHRARAE
jgi:hypothetical protein